MAMESAWVLGSLLADAAPDRVPDLLRRYEQAQLSALRNTVARFVPLRTALRPIVGLLRQQPHPSPTHLSTA